MERLGKLIEQQQEALRQIRASRPKVSLPPRPKYTVCPTCKFELQTEKDHGWVRAGIDAYTGQSIIRPCPTCGIHARDRLTSARQADLVSRLFGGNHIPHSMRNLSFDSYPLHGDQDALSQVKTWVNLALADDPDVQHGLYLGGKVGRGKTGLAVCALKKVLEAGHIGLFVLSLELLHRIRATFNSERGVSQDELLDAVTNVPWLVLDDLAVERPSEFVIEQLHYLIEQRRTRGLFTIFTSNLSTRELEKYWRPKGVQEGDFHPGVRVVERIREYCLGVIVQGANLREGDW